MAEEESKLLQEIKNAEGVFNKGKTGEYAIFFSYNLCRFLVKKLVSKNLSKKFAKFGGKIFQVKK